MTNSTEAVSSKVEDLLSSDLPISIINDLANNLSLSWIDWTIRFAFAAIIILCFKEIVFSIYRYLLLRLDKHISIGIIVKFNHGVYGKIQDYNLRSIKIETKNGIVKIPLETWLSNYYTQISQYDISVHEISENEEDLVLQTLKHDQDKYDEKLGVLFQEIHNLKHSLNKHNPSSFQTHSHSDNTNFENS